MINAKKELGTDSIPNVLGFQHLKNSGYREGKAVYLTESGLYQLIMQRIFYSTFTILTLRPRSFDQVK